MKYNTNTNKGFAGIGAIIAVIVALVVGGGVVYFATKTKAPNTENVGVNDYKPIEQSDPSPTTNSNLPSQQQTPPPTDNPPQETVSSACSGITQPTIIVDHPVANQTFSISSPFNVKWHTCNIPTTHKVYIGLMPVGEFQGAPPMITLSGSTANDGTETFTLSNFGVSADTYAVFMSDNNLPNGTTNAWSGQFTIQQQQSSQSSFFVVNADSGVNVSSPTFTVNSSTYSSINTFLAYMHTLPNGLYDVNISAPGYQTMTGAKIAVPGNLSNNIINLDPVTQAHNCPHQPSNTSAFTFCGYLADQNHNALAGVQVSSPTFSDISAVTASDGYYDTEFLPLQNYDCSNSVTFTYSKSGYKTLNYILTGPYVYMGGDMGTQLLMAPGSGTEQKTDKHGMCL